ncbi:hypothetical protein GGS23DRAFT_405855 [Durotheca rogersii]|uniref:uncharacterized protein n=1 Tax=Durotheca rogersii TaxID=419775 RepID=UPI002220EE51|nr:uncharacterized protein GGS23DRAFT_405855 [Durotheca rogersii]KAI5865041.1 hypothetical protein GGS23DRAFT_405855 [Durotheca rogersii]
MSLWPGGLQALPSLPQDGGKRRRRAKKVCDYEMPRGWCCVFASCPRKQRGLEVAGVAISSPATCGQDQADGFWQISIEIDTALPPAFRRAVLELTLLLVDFSNHSPIVSLLTTCYAMVSWHSSPDRPRAETRNSANFRVDSVARAVATAMIIDCSDLRGGRGSRTRTAQFMCGRYNAAPCVISIPVHAANQVPGYPHSPIKRYARAISQSDISNRGAVAPS